MLMPSAGLVEVGSSEGSMRAEICTKSLPDCMQDGYANSASDQKHTFKIQLICNGIAMADTGALRLITERFSSLYPRLLADLDSAMQEQVPLLSQRLRPSAHAYAQLCATET